MTGQSPGLTDHKNAEERRKGLSKDEIKDLELAGGVEGGIESRKRRPLGQGQACLRFHLRRRPGERPVCRLTSVNCRHRLRKRSAGAGGRFDSQVMALSPTLLPLHRVSADA